MRTPGAEAWAGPRAYVSSAARVLEPEGRLVGDGIRQTVARPPAGFSEFVARVGGAR